MTLSFILPCYNAGKFIADTLNSIYAQDLPEEEFEVICVNDCSTDDTHDIIAAIQAEHSNLILLDQPRNMYSGAARNRGLDVAKGEYIWFVDADDMVKPGVAGGLLRQVKDDDLDILLFNYDEFRDGLPDAFLDHPDLFRDSELLSGTSFVVKEFQGRLTFLSLLWLRLVRRSLIEDHAIHFPDMYISQDCLFAWESLLLASRVKSISGRYYNFRSSAGSITANKNTAKKAAVWSFQFPREMRKLEGRLNGKIPETIQASLESNVRHEVNQFASRYNALPATEKQAYYKAMKCSDGWFTEFRSLLSRKNRMIYHSSLFGEKCFSLAAGKLAK